MKLIYILPTLSSGGAELRAIERLNFLALHSNVQIELVVLSNIVPLLSEVNKSKNLNVSVLGLKHAEVFSKSALSSSWRNSRKLKRFLDETNADVVVASLPISHFLVRLAYLNKKKKPRIWMYHHATQYLENPVDNFQKKLLHNLNSYLCKKVDNGHIFISKAVSDDLSANLPIVNGKILYNAVPDKYADVMNLQVTMDKSNFNIVIPGRLTPVKGHIPALRSLADFLKKESSVKVWIAGDGSERTNIKAFAEENNLQNNIVLLGELEHALLLRYIFDSDLVLIPSLAEGLGNVAIEALMMASVTLVSDVGGLPEVINNPTLGTVVDISNSAAIVAAIEQIFYKRKIFEKETIRRSYVERFTMQQHVSSFLNIINS